MTRRDTLAAATLAAIAGTCSAQPVFPVQGDIAVGMSFSSNATTIRLYSPGGTQLEDAWDGFPFVQSVEWDNSGGLLHNPDGRLIGGNFGTVGGGGAVYIYKSGSANGWDGTLAFGCITVGVTTTCAPITFTTFPLSGVVARVGGVSVSPDNLKIAFTAGNDTGQVYILDYDAGTSTLSNPRQTVDLPVPLSGGTSGSAWLDNTTVMAVSPDGNLVTVDASAANPTAVSRLALPGAATSGSRFASMCFVEPISDFVYVSISDFQAGSGVTTNRLYAVNPVTWTVANQIDLSTSNPTSREIALAANGDLFISTFSGSAPPASPPGGLFRIPDVRNPANMTNNSSVQVTLFGANTSFNGMDVACAASDSPVCYADCNASGTLTVADFGCFQGKYVLGDLYADCNASGTLTVADFGCFQGKYVLGCP
ncbi:MAG: hypothetical protein ACKVU4_15775 [Phycisphaerales bacterium]